jgi:hypothetical protein
MNQRQKDLMRRHFLQPHVAPEGMRAALRMADGIRDEQIASQFQVLLD